MDLQLRPYQREALAAVKEDWQTHNSLLVVAATGSGKTVMFLQLLFDMMEANLSRSLLLSHRLELVQQPLDKIREFWPKWEWRTGIVMAEQNQCDRQLTLGSMQTLMQPHRLAKLLWHGPMDYVVIDECFPAGTIIDGHPIETIKVGDIVTAFDETNGELRQHRVSHLFKRPAPAQLMRIKAGGRTVICTPNHPFWTAEGWKPAYLLSNCDMVQCTIQSYDNIGGSVHDQQKQRKTVHGLRKNRLRLVHAEVPAMCQQAPGKSDRDGLYCLSVTCNSQGESSPCSLWKGESSVLFGCMQRRIQGKGVFRNDGAHQSEICFCQNESQESNARPDSQGKDAHDIAGDGMEATCSSRKRQRANGATTATCVCARLGDGSGYLHWLSSRESREYCARLQSRHRESNTEGSNRSGREFALQPKSGRCQENGGLEWARVDSVEVLEQGSDQTFGGLCPDGFVYNLEVEDLHTYVANGFIVHNCHHTTSKSYLNLIDSLKEANPNLRILGVTATPIRSDGDGLKKVFQKVSYKAGIKELITLGYLVPFKAIGVQTAVSLNGVKSRDGDYLQKQLADVVEVDNNLDLVVESHKRWAENRPTIAFTVSVDGAYRLAEKFRQAGITAEAADGTTAKDDRKGLLDRFKRGQIQVLCNVGIWTEGLDLPRLACAHMVRPTKSDGLYCQMVGRILRTYPDKQDALIIDYAPVDARNIVMAGDLLGKARAQKKLEADAAKQGLLIEGFTFAGGEGTGIDGDVDELIARPLNYLTQSPFTWAFDEGYSALGLGEDDRGTKRTLIIAPPNGQPHFHLYGVRKAKDGAEEVMPLGAGEFEELAEKARVYIDRYGIGVLVSKDRGWQREPITDGQMKMLRWLAKGEGERVKGLSKGQAARLITIRMARKSLEKAGIC